jgi:4-oxalocrotonate tautomerase
MPHANVKLAVGRTEDQKRRLAEAVTKAITSTLNLGEESVSVAIEDVEPERWTTEVYEPEIVRKRGTIYKKPGYGPTR